MGTFFYNFNCRMFRRCPTLLLVFMYYVCISMSSIIAFDISRYSILWINDVLWKIICFQYEIYFLFDLLFSSLNFGSVHIFFFFIIGQVLDLPGVDVKGVLDKAGLAPEEHHVERRVPARRNDLQGNQSSWQLSRLESHLIVKKWAVKMEGVARYRQHLYAWMPIYVVDRHFSQQWYSNRPKKG